MNKLAFLAFAVCATANADLRIWDVSGDVGYVSGPNLPLPVNVGDSYSFVFTIDTATPGQPFGNCSLYDGAIKAVAVRVGDKVIADPIDTGTTLMVCHNDATYGDDIALGVDGAFGVQVDMSSQGQKLKSTAIPLTPPKLPRRIALLLGAPVNGVSDYFSAPIKTITSR